jgi:hypothetical protein
MTVVARRIRATPARPASEGWQVIIELLAPAASDARDELLRVEGIASSLIASQAMKDAPIVVYGGGPRVRIYCLYDEEAIEGEQANEQKLATCPTEDDWALSLPAPSEDLKWVQDSLKKRSSRVTARDMAEPVVTGSSDEEGGRKSTGAVINPEEFFRS